MLFTPAQAREIRERKGILTMRPKMIISQIPFTMYIFQPMLFKPIGMINTKTSLR